MKPFVLSIGESHLLAPSRAFSAAPEQCGFNAGYVILVGGFYNPVHIITPDRVHWSPKVEEDIAQYCDNPNLAFVATSLMSNIWSPRAFFENERPYDFLAPGDMQPLTDRPREVIPIAVMRARARTELQGTAIWFRQIRRFTDKTIVEILPPPPVDLTIGNDPMRYIGQHDRELFRRRGIFPGALRIKLWNLYASVTRDICREAGVNVLEVPSGTRDANGFLADHVMAGDSHHANTHYGKLLLEQFGDIIDGKLLLEQFGDIIGGSSKRRRAGTAHPYAKAPAYRFWRQAVAAPSMADIDPVITPVFTLSPTDKIATAGSCFAQHLARHISNAGMSYFVTEPGHPSLSDTVARDFGYGTFSARFGNIYTTRQLLQLLQRAYGEFQPLQDTWAEADGAWIDPFRPRVQPNGFESEVELIADRESHFSAVRCMIEELDVFVFTLGLTETYYDCRDGAVYPVCPGVAGGVFDESIHKMANYRVQEVTDDLTQALDFIRLHNPKARFILTVSPVPLVATAEDRHVLVATTYSKACLRVACEEVARSIPGTAYFPSYEIITGNHARGSYFAEDLRSVTEDGVRHVMAVFMRNYVPDLSSNLVEQPVSARVTDAETVRRAAAVIKIICDEEALERP